MRAFGLPSVLILAVGCGDGAEDVSGAGGASSSSGPGGAPVPSESFFDPWDDDLLAAASGYPHFDSHFDEEPYDHYRPL